MADGDTAGVLWIWITELGNSSKNGVGGAVKHFDTDSGSTVILLNYIHMWDHIVLILN